MNHFKRFIILSSQRSGSTFIRIWLNRHSNIYCYGEVFLGHYRSPDGLYSFCSNNYSKKLRFYLHYLKLARRIRLNFIHYGIVDDYLQHLFTDKCFPAPWTDIDNRNPVSAKLNKNVVGFKIMHGTVRFNSNIHKWIIKQKPYVIHLLRDNLLKKYISQKRMTISKLDHTKKGIKTEPIFVDSEELMNFINSTHETYEYYRKLYSCFPKYHEITYENFFNNYAEEKFKLLAFLEQDTEEMPLSNIMKKISTSNIKNEIINYKQIIQLLRKKKLTHYLKDFSDK